jgi:hypothetical protein
MLFYAIIKALGLANFILIIGIIMSILINTYRNSIYIKIKFNDYSEDEQGAVSVSECFKRICDY